MFLIILLLLTVGFGIARFLVPVSGEIAKKDIYKDFAHIFVGFLFGAAYVTWDSWELWAMAVGLTALEVVAFIVRKNPKA